MYTAQAEGGAAPSLAIANGLSQQHLSMLQKQDQEKADLAQKMQQQQMFHARQQNELIAAQSLAQQQGLGPALVLQEQQGVATRQEKTTHNDTTTQ